MTRRQALNLLRLFNIYLSNPTQRGQERRGLVGGEVSTLNYNIRQQLIKLLSILGLAGKIGPKAMQRLSLEFNRDFKNNA